MLVWILAGCVLVTAVFFLAPQGPDPWPALNAAGIAALLYVLALLFTVVKKPFTLRARLSIYTIAVVMVIAIYSAWTGMDERSHWQRNQLRKINAVLNHGVIMSELHSDFLLPVFEQFHNQRGRRRVTLGQVFRRAYPNAKVGENIRPPSGFDSIRVYLSELSDTHVALIGQSMYVPGKNPEFKNYNGRIGAVQARAIVTAKGVAYEKEN
jgi:hypothetical protein